MIDNLTREIIKRILANVGAVPGFIGDNGLASKRFNLLKKISISYSDGTYHHDIYAGQLSIKEKKLRGLLVDLTVEDDSEFLFIFQLDQLPIHVFRLVFNPDHLDTDCYVKIQKQDKSWSVPDTHTMCMMLANFEKFVSYGLLWEDCKEVSDLYEVAVKLINKE